MQTRAPAGVNADDPRCLESGGKRLTTGSGYKLKCMKEGMLMFRLHKTWENIAKGEFSTIRKHVGREVC